MATPYPPIDLSDPVILAILTEARDRLFPDGIGLEEYEYELQHQFDQYFQCPNVCALMKDVMSGRWQLGSTEGDIAENLGVGRDRIQMARNKGRMTVDLYLKLAYCPTRPKDYRLDDSRLVDEMLRHGFIGAAKFTACKFSSRPTLRPQELTEFTYELACLSLANLVELSQEALDGGRKVAPRMIDQVLSEPQHTLPPAWYSDHLMAQFKVHVSHFCDQELRQLGRLDQFMEAWLDVIILTLGSLQTIGRDSG